MSERERWIIYPLLFLALGAALRDKLFNRTTSKSIVCQELVILDDQGLPGQSRPLARIGLVESTTPNTPPTAQIVLKGSLHVDAIVTDTIVARNYTSGGGRFLPSYRNQPKQPGGRMIPLRIVPQPEPENRYQEPESPAGESADNSAAETSTNSAASPAVEPAE